MAFSLPDLPYPKTALEPHITERTLDFHHGKHHNAYVNNLNKLIEGTDLTDLSLEDIMKKTVNDSAKIGIFNNAAQVWNHSFYWQCMKPDGGGEPKLKIMERIQHSFGDFGKFREELKSAAATQFGSGWAWLVEDGKQLKVVKTANAANPLTDGLKPLLTIDVWEHAYYLDYQNRRPDYVSTFLDKLVNWEFVNGNLST